MKADRRQSIAAELVSLAKLWRVRSRLGLVRHTELRPAASPEQLAQVLARARRIVEDWNCQLIFVYLPSLGTYRAPLFGRNDHRRDDVLSAIRQLNIPILDIHQTFSHQPNPLSMFPLRTDGTRALHYGPAGYEVVARAIFDDMRARIASQAARPAPGVVRP